MKAFNKRIKAIRKKLNIQLTYTNILFFLSACFALALLFLFGYGFGYKDAKVNPIIPVTPSVTPVIAHIDFTITPYPPDESGWVSNNLTIHYHSFKVKMPADYILQRSQNGTNVFENQDGNTITYTPSNAHTIHTNTQVDVFDAQYTHTVSDSIDTDTIDISLINENLIVTYHGSQNNYWLFRDIYQTIIFAAQTPSYPPMPQVIQTSIASLTYSSRYIADSLNRDITNCKGQPESIFTLIDDNSTITMDINTCNTVKTQTIASAKTDVINKKTYFLVSFSASNLCYVNPDSLPIGLRDYPLKSWIFSPRVTSMQNKPVQICMQIHTGLTQVRQALAIKDFHNTMSGLSVY